MNALDYTGQHGGLLALAFASGCVFASGVMMAVGRFIWRTFLEKRVKDLEAQLLDERKECDRRISHLEAEISQLRTLLLMHGPQALRQEIQKVISEGRVGE